MYVYPGCSILREGECLCFRFLAKGSLNSEPLGEREYFMFGADGRFAIVSPVGCSNGQIFVSFIQ